MEILQLQQYIRFAISQLASDNGSSDFEKICFHVARKRIHSNIIPATGPVQAGGDQGRDFETFHTYLSESSIAQASFVAMASSGAVAFACSLEKDPTKKNGKIQKDVTTIMGSGSKVERIYFFSGQDIPVAIRHKCQKELEGEFKVDVEIFDAQALSLQLSDSDIFWIAIQYLKIPAESYPEQKSDHWYDKLFQEYHTRNLQITTIQEFTEVKSALRRIYKDDLLKKDLLFWLSKLDILIAQGNLPVRLIRQAVYEKFVASLVGMDNVEGQEDNIQFYFERFEAFDTPAELEDSQVLLSFCVNSRLAGRNTLTQDYLNEISERFEKKIRERIEKTDILDTKCLFLDIYANFNFHDHRGSRNINELFNRFVATLNELILFLPDTHFYPTERLSGRLNELIETIGKLPIEISELENLAMKVDTIVATKAGAKAAANSVNSRAQFFIKKKELFKAIELLHKAKVLYYNQDTLEDVISSCYLISSAYQEIGMTYAGKYYALLGAYLSIESSPSSLSHLFTDGVLLASDCDYQTGNWGSFVGLHQLLTASHVQMTKDFEIYKHKDAASLLYYPAMILEVARKLDSNLYSIFESEFNKLGWIGGEITEMRKELANKFAEQNFDVINATKSQIKDVPFNDMAVKRRIRFNAIGCIWTFTFKNNRACTAVSEQFIAMFQILLTELNSEDLYNIATDIYVELELSDSEPAAFEIIPDKNKRNIWKISLPSYIGKTVKDLQDHEFGYLVVAQALLSEISLLPKEEYLSVFGEKMDNGLTNKLSFGRWYEDLYYEFSQELDICTKTAISLNEIFYDSWPIPNNNHYFQWKDTRAGKYNENRELSAIRNRIQTISNIFPRTLAELKKSSSFLKIIENLQRESWLDWQIFQAIASVSTAYKIQQKAASGHTMKDIFRISQQYAYRPEQEWFIAIPEEVLSYERLKTELTLMLPLSVLFSLGLENRSDNPDSGAIWHLLVKRFNFGTDGRDIKVF